MEFCNRAIKCQRKKEKQLGVGPCLTGVATALRGSGDEMGSYVTFLDTARAEGERSTPWSPATGLNFKKDQTKRRKRRRRRKTKRKRRRRSLEVDRNREKVK